MIRIWRLFIHVAVIGTLMFGIAGHAGGADGGAPQAPGATRSLADILGATAAGFEKATRARPFVFPSDHGPHNSFQTEWWYVTGHLFDEAKRHYGVQLTFFRYGLTPKAPQGQFPRGQSPQADSSQAHSPRTQLLRGQSKWRAQDVYMAHLALSDVSAGAFYKAQRLTRGALGLAGAQGSPLKVWVEDWQMAAPSVGEWPWRAVARDTNFGLDLTIQRGKSPVANGEAGLSRKSALGGNASHYYSMTRMPAAGTLRTPSGTREVTGELWLDREWSSSALASNQIGWDWFALQLNDGRELMFYRLRNVDGGIDAASAGTLVKSDGSVRHLSKNEVHIDVLERWQSPHSTRLYPSRWRFEVPELDIALTLTPVLADQEHQGPITYWEGAVLAVDADGVSAGRGYVEMTGY
jgi:predicted secreted hydrolase